MDLCDFAIIATGNGDGRFIRLYFTEVIELLNGISDFDEPLRINVFGFIAFARV